MLMRYINKLTGVEIVANSEMSAPHLVKVDEVEEKATTKKPATVKKGTKKK